MARKARSVDNSTLISITQKSKVALFRDDQDREMMLKILKQTQDKFGYECFAYCLLDEKIFQLILDTKGRSISAIMSSILMSYRAYRQVEGKLFVGRFTSKPIHDEKELGQEIALIQKQSQSQYNSYCFHCQDARHPEQFRVNLNTRSLTIGAIESNLSLEEARLKLQTWMNQKGCDPQTFKQDKDLRNQCLFEFRRNTNCSLKVLGSLFELSESTVSKILTNNRV